MAFFKSRKGGDEPVAQAAQPESIEALRRRARHRLIGAAVLVLVGIVGFPLVFDTQPRPIAVDIPIEIPDRNKVKPLAAPAPPAAPAPAVAAGPVTPAASEPSAVGRVREPAAAPSAAESPAPKTEVAKAEAAKPEPKPEPKAAEAKPEPKAAEAKPQPKPDDGARAQALLEGRPPENGAAVEGRFVVQVGAFSDATKAAETRQKMERAGLKTYTQVAETKDGKRIRVRVGPFPTRAEADKAAQKIKGLDLPAAILTL